MDNLEPKETENNLENSGDESNSKSKKSKTKDKTEPKEYSIEDFEKDYNKFLGRDALLSPKITEIGVENIPRITTGSILLDCDLGGGYPCWRINEIIGYESVGKSYLINKAMAGVTSRGEYVYFADTEKSWDEYWATQCGVDIKYVKMSDCLFAEQEMDMFEMAIRSGVFKLVVLDSIADLSVRKELEAENEKESMARLAALLSKSLKKVLSALSEAKRKNKEVYVILTNQFRAKIGMFVGGVTEPGGNAMKYKPSVKIELKKADNIQEGADEIVGQVTEYIIKKNKTFTPLKTGELRYFFDNDRIGDIDNYRGLFDIGVKFGFIEKSGAWYSGEWISGKVQGAENATLNLMEQDIDKLNEYVLQVEKVALPNRKLCFRF